MQRNYKWALQMRGLTQPSHITPKHIESITSLQSTADSQDRNNADLTLSQSKFYKVYVSVYT